MNSNQNKFLGFTLVELIVVITIVGILSTVGFVSYSGYLTSARDSNRISQLTKLSDSLQVYSASKTLPLPDDNIDITASGAIIAYQGEVGVDVLETIDYTNGGKDPKDDAYYSYYLTKDRKSLQLMALMEEQQSVASVVTSNETYAQFENRYPKVYGRKLGILTQNDTNLPIQNLTITSFELLTETGYTGHISDDEKVVGQTLGELTQIIPNASCYRVKQTGGAGSSGIYIISPNGEDMEVYCDMETAGGGWTTTSMLADSSTVNLFETGNSETVQSISKNISTKGNISEIWLDNTNKDIMLQCFVSANDEFARYESPFYIYDFNKDDIGNLTKDGKSGTVFSSSSLQAKWKNINYTLETNYDGADANPSMYLRGSYSGGTGRIFGILITGSDVTQLYQNVSGATDSPYSFSPAQGLTLDENNYCVTYIK